MAKEAAGIALTALRRILDINPFDYVVYILIFREEYR